MFHGLERILVGIAFAGAVAWASPAVVVTASGVSQAETSNATPAETAPQSQAAVAVGHYDVSLRKDVALTLGAAFAAIYGQYRLQNMEVPDDADVREPSDLLPWDRGFAGRYNETADNVSSWSGALAVAPLALAGYSWYAGDASGADFGAFTLMFAQALALQSGLNLMVRSLGLWPRPYVYAKYCNADGNNGEDRGAIDCKSCTVSDSRAVRKANAAEGEAYGSFFSGHASAAFTVAVFTGEWFSEMYPNSPYRGVVWAGAFSAAGLVGALRIAAGKHYPSDVIVGALAGVGVSLAVIEIHKGNSNRIALWSGFNSLGITFSL